MWFIASSSLADPSPSAFLGSKRTRACRERGTDSCYLGDQHPAWRASLAITHVHTYLQHSDVCYSGMSNMQQLVPVDEHGILLHRSTLHGVLCVVPDVVGTTWQSNMSLLQAFSVLRTRKCTLVASALMRSCVVLAVNGHVLTTSAHASVISLLLVVVDTCSIVVAKAFSISRSRAGGE